MIITSLAVLGLCLGSFVNALVWRLHAQSKQSQKPKAKSIRHSTYKLSILRGRSMCTDCKHELAAWDLVPVISWLAVGGKCRYCKRPISVQYPLVELAAAALFVASYIWWPEPVAGLQAVAFGLWLMTLTGLLALLVYDLRWLLLPDRIMYPLGGIAVLYALVSVALADKPLTAFINVLLSVAIGGGIFYVLFQVSAGKWIGGGDVKLGWLLGLLVGTPAKAVLFIFMAALLGTLVSLPLLASKRLERTSVIPFGPFLIVAAIAAQLFGQEVLGWYQSTFLPYTV